MDETSRIYTIQLQINSQLEHVRLLGSALRGIGQELELNNTQLGQLELILVETVNNVIEHAYEFQSGSQVTVTIECTPDDNMKLTISDRGKSMPQGEQLTFSETDISFPEPESLPESGWGMGLINLLADSFRYERADNQNYWHVTKRLA
ncbi:MAG: ATP-binding protein [Thiolinea sp.]